MKLFRRMKSNITILFPACVLFSALSAAEAPKPTLAEHELVFPGAPEVRHKDVREYLIDTPSRHLASI